MSTNTSKDKSASENSARASSVMGQLLAKHKNLFVTLKKGESVKGKITKLSTHEILVDTGAKTEALVLEKDKRILRSILSMFKVGDTVDVNVLNPESETGQPIVSLRRYLGDLAWTKLEALQKSKEQIDALVAESAKAGYLVNTDFGVSGFLPQSHTALASQQELTPGAKIKVSVLELNRKDNKIIFSQKTSLSEEEFTAITKALAVGQKVTATIVNVTPFGLFVSFPLPKAEKTIEGFIHISEASWEKVEDLAGLYQSGQQIEAVITRFDAETRRVNLSIKRLTADPFEDLMAKFPVDKKVSGTVSKVDSTGVLLTLGDEIEGLIKKEKIPPTTTYTVGQTVTAIVSEHDKRRHRITLVPVLLEKPIGYR